MSDDNSVQDNHDDGGNGINLGMDLIQALLSASLDVPGADQLDNVEAISGEYSSLNKTMDELNNFLDRWDERHDRLREEIRDVLSEQEQETGGDDGEGSKSAVTETASNSNTTKAADVSSCSGATVELTGTEKKEEVSNSNCTALKTEEVAKQNTADKKPL